jgi:hypothetical protein
MFEGLDDGSFAGIAQIDDPDFSVPCATTVYAWTWTDGDLNVVPQSRGETDQSLDREDRDATVPERGDLRRIEMQPYREEAGSHWCAMFRIAFANARRIASLFFTLQCVRHRRGAHHPESAAGNVLMTPSRGQYWQPQRASRR